MWVLRLDAILRENKTATFFRPFSQAVIYLLSHTHSHSGAVRITIFQTLFQHAARKHTRQALVSISQADLLLKIHTALACNLWLSPGVVTKITVIEKSGKLRRGDYDFSCREVRERESVKNSFDMRHLRERLNTYTTNSESERDYSNQFYVTINICTYPVYPKIDDEKLTPIG